MDQTTFYTDHPITTGHSRKESAGFKSPPATCNHWKLGKLSELFGLHALPLQSRNNESIIISHMSEIIRRVKCIDIVNALRTRPGRDWGLDEWLLIKSIQSIAQVLTFQLYSYSLCVSLFPSTLTHQFLKNVFSMKRHSHQFPWNKKPDTQAQWKRKKGLKGVDSWSCSLACSDSLQRRRLISSVSSDRERTCQAKSVSILVQPPFPSLPTRLPATKL